MSREGNKTTDAERRALIRRSIQASTSSVRKTAQQHGVNFKTVLKWRKRVSVEDLPVPSRSGLSIRLTPFEEAIVIAYRQYTLFSLPDCTAALKQIIPHLNQSLLYRCFRRHDLSSFSKLQRPRPLKKTDDHWHVGRFRLDILEVRSHQENDRLWISTDICTKYSMLRLEGRNETCNLNEFLRLLLADSSHRPSSIDVSDAFLMNADDRERTVGALKQYCADEKLEYRISGGLDDLSCYHSWSGRSSGA